MYQEPLFVTAGNDCELKTIVTCFEFVFWSSSHCMIYLVSSWNARNSEFIVCYKGYPLKSWASEILTWMWSIGTSFQAGNEAIKWLHVCSMTPHMKGLLCSWPHTWKAAYAHDRTHKRPPMLMTAHMKGLLRVDNLHQLNTTSAQARKWTLRLRSKLQKRDGRKDSAVCFTGCMLLALGCAWTRLATSE